MSLTYADEHRELVEELDERLRAAVRLDGIDPQRDTGQVHVLARRLVADHDQRPLTGIVPLIDRPVEGDVPLDIRAPLLP
jgi:pilus assembly protein CpaF